MTAPRIAQERVACPGCDRDISTEDIAFESLKECGGSRRVTSCPLFNAILGDLLSGVDTTPEDTPKL